MLSGRANTVKYIRYTAFGYAPTAIMPKAGISVFEVKNTSNIPETFVLPNQNYSDCEVMELILVSAGRNGENLHDLLRFLNAVFYNYKDKERYREVLEDFFETSGNRRQLFEEVDNMSEFELNIYEEGIEKGIEKGMEEGMEKGAAQSAIQMVLRFTDSMMPISEIYKFLKGMLSVAQIDKIRNLYLCYHISDENEIYDVLTADK